MFYLEDEWQRGGVGGGATRMEFSDEGESAGQTK